MLFEVLSYEEVLEDSEVMRHLESALLQLAHTHELGLSEGGRYPGIYHLMAHSNPLLRSLVPPPPPRPLPTHALLPGPFLD